MYQIVSNLHAIEHHVLQDKDKIHVHHAKQPTRGALLPTCRCVEICVWAHRRTGFLDPRVRVGLSLVGSANARAHAAALPLPLLSILGSSAFPEARRLCEPSSPYVSSYVLFLFLSSCLLPFTCEPVGI